MHGLRLTDGRRVVIKVHGPRAQVEFLRAVRVVQQRLSKAGFPAPQPLAGPARLGAGTATAELLYDRGGRADAHQPEIRLAMASSLARLVELARPSADLPGLRLNMMEVPEGQLWPNPHDERFDFELTADGAGWIDRIAARARPLRDREAGALVVGHTDWRVQHLRFLDCQVTAVYDWDSLSVVSEPALVGSVAHGFTTDWAVDQRPQFPSLDEALAFIADYEQGRGARFRDHERAIVHASLVYTMAYTARCEHSDALTDMGRRPARRAPAVAQVPDGSARRFLTSHAADLLGAHDSSLSGRS